MNPFEDRLWSYLVSEYAADRAAPGAPAGRATHGASDPAPGPGRARRRRGPLVLGVGAVGATAVVLVLILGVGATTSTPPAYALTENSDGTVTVTLNDVATGIPGLNAEFARLGIRERAIPIEAGCTAGPAVGYDASGSAPGMNGMGTTFTFSSSNRYLDPGDTGFIAARQVGPNEVEIAMGAMKPPLPSCFPTTTAQVRAAPAGTATGTGTAASPTGTGSTSTGSATTASAN